MKPVNCLLLFSAALLFPRCTHDDAVPVAEPIEIRVSAGFVAGGVESRSADDANDAYSSENLSATPLPVSAVRLDQTSITGTYLPYTLTNSGGTGAPRAAQLKGESGEIWMTFNEKETYLARTQDGNHDNTKLIGWYPPVGEATGYSAWSVDGLGNATVAFTVDGKTDILMSGLMEGSRKKPFGDFGNGMVFKHLLARFAVRVFTRDATLAAQWGPVKAIRIKGKAQQCAVVLPGVEENNNTYPTNITFTNSGDLELDYKNGEPGTIPVITGSSFEDVSLVGTVMVAPETSTNAKENKIILEVECEKKSGRVEIVPGANINGKFLAGSSYVLSLEFTDHIGVEGCTLADWGDKSENNDLLTASETEFNLPYAEISGHTLVLKTNTPVKPTWSLSDDADSDTGTPDWITLSSLSTGNTDTNGFTAYTLTFGTTKNAGAEMRTGYIRVSAGELKLAVKVNQGIFPVPDNLSNCYLVTPNATSVSIPITRAITVGGMNPSAGDATVEILWDDNTVISGNPTLSGSGDARTIEVQLSDKEGNAVVALQRGSTIYWSWHIWVTDYEPTTTNTWQNNGYTFMDRNLGATEATLFPAGRGLFYQWGRKDPFPGGPGAAGHAALSRFSGLGIGIKVTNLDANDAGIYAGLLESVRKPTTFFSPRNKPYYDWLPKSENTLWNTTTGKKTVFDPCPAGWRVPVGKGGTENASDNNSPWYGVSNTSGWAEDAADDGGVNFGTNALYPASGHRYYSEGGFESGGSYGSYWTASVSNFHGIFLDFGKNGNVYYSNENHRPTGNSVRCVKDNP